MSGGYYHNNLAFAVFLILVLLIFADSFNKY